MAKKSNQSTNFTFVYGCKPGGGVEAATKFVNDLIRLLVRNFSMLNGKLRIPQVFNQILSSDATFEIATCVLSRELVLGREDDIIGHRFLVYAFDKKKDKEMKDVREHVIQFFKKRFGLEVIQLDIEDFPNGFTLETQKEISKITRQVFCGVQKNFLRFFLSQEKETNRHFVLYYFLDEKMAMLTEFTNNGRNWIAVQKHYSQLTAAELRIGARLIVENESLIRMSMDKDKD